LSHGAKRQKKNSTKSEQENYLNQILKNGATNNLKEKLPVVGMIQLINFYK